MVLLCLGQFTNIPVTDFPKHDISCKTCSFALRSVLNLHSVSRLNPQFPVLQRHWCNGRVGRVCLHRGWFCPQQGTLVSVQRHFPLSQKKGHVFSLCPRVPSTDRISAHSTVIQLVFNEHLLCAGRWPGSWGSVHEQLGKGPSSHEADILGQNSNKRTLVRYLRTPRMRGGKAKLNEACHRHPAGSPTLQRCPPSPPHVPAVPREASPSGHVFF